MWRVIKSIGRGVRSVRPSQCCPQDCCEEDPSKYYKHHYYYNEISKAKTATLRHYGSTSCGSPLTIRNYDSFLATGEGIHTASCDNESSHTEGRDNASYYPRCPPWHWQTLQDCQNLEKYCSEKEEKEEKQNTNDWEKTCHSHEWTEVLQSSPTLHALGWGSAAVLTWSLYHDWREHHPCPYLNKKEEQTPHRTTRKKDVKIQDQKTEETLYYHKPFKDCFPFESNSNKVSSESLDAEDNDKNCLREIHEVTGFQYNVNSTKTHTPNLVKSHKCDIEETIIPVYSLQQQFLDITRKVFKNQESDYVKEKHKLEEDETFNNLCESPLSLDKSNVLDKTDSDCMPYLDQSYLSQTSSTLLEKVHSQGDLSEESSIISTERPITDDFETELSTEEEDVSEHCQPTTQDVSVKNSDNDEIKILQDRLLEIVKAQHEERLSDILKRDGNSLLNTKPEELIVYFQAGVLVGDATSAFNLALCYHMGRGITQDLEKARKLYEAASSAGHGWATYNLAVMLNHGLGGPFLPQKAHSLLLQAAKMGVKEAQEALAGLEQEEEQQHTVSQEDGANLRHCYSEPCLLSALNKEWSLSYSTGDLHSLLDEDDWTVSDLTTLATISKRN